MFMCCCIIWCVVVRVAVGKIDVRKMGRMANVLFERGFTEGDVLDFVMLFLLDMAISDRKTFDEMISFIKDNADHMKSKGVKSVFEYK